MISCCCSLTLECCRGCLNNRVLSWDHPFNQMPPLPVFEFSKMHGRKFNWLLKGEYHRNNGICLYFDNADRGLECTAKRCPCDLYETDMP
jgi:hypothetical protein